MKTMSPKNVAWSLGLAFALFITGLTSAFCTGHLAVVSTERFALTRTDAVKGASMAECEQTKFRTYGGETEVIIGRSVDLPYETTGGTVIRHADLRFGGASTTTPIVLWWGSVSSHGRPLDGEGGNDPNWVTFTCMDRTRHTM